MSESSRQIRTAPWVSVVMPVYNGQTYLAEAVESILTQTFTDFEFIIIDDGSTDESGPMLAAYAARDHRIRLMRNERNLKLIETLNRGLALARGKYIARQDADDVSFPARLARQVAYLEQHPEVGLLGTAYYRLTGDGQRSLRRPPLTDTEIRWRLLFGNIWCHPSMMVRRQLLPAGEPVYRHFRHAEDYELWLRLLERSQGATLPEPLLDYRVHRDSICAIHADLQDQTVAGISARQIKSLLPDRAFSPGEIKRLRACHHPQQLTGKDLALCPVMLDLFRAFARQPGLDQKLVHQLRRQWIKQVLANIPAKQWFNLAGIARLLGAILRHDFPALLLAGFVQWPKRSLRQIHGGIHGPS